MMYKIRLKNNPTLYVKGTPADHTHNKNGRVFPTLGLLRSFITNTMNSSRGNSVSNWEIVEYIMEVKAVKDVHEVITPDKLVKLLTK